MIALWFFAVIAGMLIAVIAGKHAVKHATGLIVGTRVPPFFVGITLVAIGTDLPEIANSIASSAAGHGDLNVGDSMGSTVTQIALILGLMPFVAGAFAVDRRQVIVTGTLTCCCVAIGAASVTEGVLSRSEAALLMCAWLACSYVVWRTGRLQQPTAVHIDPTRKRAHHALLALLLLALVGVGAALAVGGLIEIAAMLALPEYLISFFALSLGTSLPEFIVNVTALRRSEYGLAIGGVFGASMVDASLSIAAGPLLFPNVVDPDLAVRGALVAFATVAVATLVLGWRGRVDRKYGAMLLILYAATYPILITP